jgi:hypothetical protein
MKTKIAASISLEGTAEISSNFGMKVDLFLSLRTLTLICVVGMEMNLSPFFCRGTRQVSGWRRALSTELRAQRDLTQIAQRSGRALETV